MLRTQRLWAFVVTTTIAVMSQAQTKQQLLAELQTLAASVSDREVRHKLDDAAQRVADSLAPELWDADGIHLDPQRGGRVFDLEKQAVTKLREVIDAPRSMVSDEALVRLIRGFATVDRQIAITAIGGRTSDIGHALRDLDEGDAALAAGRADRAIEQFRKTSEDATPRG
jgi:hypothetical protein